MESLRIALAQINPTVGDIPYNQTRIAHAICQAQAWHVDVVVMPELAITGYPPEDLLLKCSFVEANHKALAHLAVLAQGLIAVVGFVDRDASGKLYNAAAVLWNGRHVATYHKRCLPNYGVFDERRYFHPGQDPLIIPWGHWRLGIAICEDLWEEFPCHDLASSGAQLILGLSASPYHAGKALLRQRLFATRAQRNAVAIASCNLIGGQDELVFDGASFIIDRRGRVLAQGAQFREDFVLADVKVQQAGTLRSTHRNVSRRIRVDGKRASQNFSRPVLYRWSHKRMEHLEEIYAALTLGLCDYVRKNHFETAVLGISGGIDSALTACIAVDALGADHVVGLIMPSRFSSQATQKDARRLASALGIRSKRISIEPLFQAYEKLTRQLMRDLFPLAPSVQDRLANATGITEQNIQARIRGNLLMALSNQFGYLVLTTGNKSEMATGYTTLYGDMAGGFAVIKDVPKTLVYQLARFRNPHGPGSIIPESVFVRAPTAELAANQTDQQTLPPYPVLDRILKAYVEQDLSLRDIVREDRTDPQTVRRVIRMVDRSEYKRRQGPPGIKITPKAFGKDRRMPITNRYQET